MKRILSQIEQQVKCADEWCDESIYRNGLCFEHFVEVETQAWDDWDADRQAVLEEISQ